MEEDKYRSIFIKMINKYNDERAFYGHYVQISEKELMVIS